MGDQFDPCECINILDHEGRMQRLLHLLRSSQTDCTDNECLTPDAGFNGLGGQTQMGMQWTFVMGWILLAAILYYLRPSRSRTGPTGKGSGNHSDHGNGGNDPAPVL